MERTIHNPWTWQEKYGFHQANEVTNPARTLYCSGQTAVDADGAAQHAGEWAHRSAWPSTTYERSLPPRG